MEIDTEKPDTVQYERDGQKVSSVTSYRMYRSEQKSYYRLNQTKRVGK